MQVATRIHTQPKKASEGDSPRSYSVHAPEVERIAKRKAHKQYEFGVKVGIVFVSRDNFVLAAKSPPGIHRRTHATSVYDAGHPG